MTFSSCHGSPTHVGRQNLEAMREQSVCVTYIEQTISPRGAGCSVPDLHESLNQPASSRQTTKPQAAHRIVRSASQADRMTPPFPAGPLALTQSGGASLGGCLSMETPRLLDHSTNASRYTKSWDGRVNVSRQPSANGSNIGTYTPSANCSILDMFSEIINRLKMEHKEDIKRLKAQFDSKLGCVEKKITQSILQPNFESRLLALECAVQKSEDVGPKFDSRLSAVEDSMALLAELRELIHQHSSELNKEIQTIKTNITKALFRIEEQIGIGSMNGLQHSMHKDGSAYIFEDRAAGVQDAISRMSFTQIPSNKTHQKPEQGGRPQNSTMAQRLCVVEGNVDLITSILQKMSDGSNEARTSIGSLRSPWQVCRPSAIMPFSATYTTENADQGALNVHDLACTCEAVDVATAPGLDDIHYKSDASDQFNTHVAPSSYGNRRCYTIKEEEDIVA